MNKIEKRFASLSKRAKAVDGDVVVAFARAPLAEGTWRVASILDTGASMQRSLDVIEGMIVERERERAAR